MGSSLHTKSLGGTAFYSEGTGTTVTMLAIDTASFVGGETFYNTNWQKLAWWDGDIWMTKGVVKLINRSGAARIEGEAMAFSAADPISAIMTVGNDDLDTIGPVVLGGSNLAFITLARNGIWNIRVNTAIVLQNIIYASGGTGFFYDSNLFDIGACGNVIEAYAGGPATLIKAAIFPVEGN